MSSHNQKYCNIGKEGDAIPSSKAVDVLGKEKANKFVRDKLREVEDED